MELLDQTADLKINDPLESAKRVLWGDKSAGDTLDWIYITGGKVHQMVWGMPPGGVYRQSEQNPTLVAAGMTLPRPQRRAGGQQS